ncbi:hypothetical protein ACQY0O_004830 [Thecaphora frezii]
MVKRSAVAGRLTVQAMDRAASRSSAVDEATVHHDPSLFAQALASALERCCFGTATVDEEELQLVGDAVEHVAGQVCAETLVGLLGPAVALDLEDSSATYDGTLSSLEGHAVEAAIAEAATEMLGQEKVNAALILSEALDGYRDRLVWQGNEGGRAEDWHSYERVGKKGELGECQLCERSMLLTAHHLIPRERHEMLLKRNVFTKHEMKTRIAWLCRACHSAVHKLIPTSELATEYNTVEKLLEHEDVYRWARYASGLKEKDGNFKGEGLREKR